MLLTAFAICPLLIATGILAEDCLGAQPPDSNAPGACLLQQGSAQLQRATRVKEVEVIAKKEGEGLQAQLGDAAARIRKEMDSDDDDSATRFEQHPEDKKDEKGEKDEKDSKEGKEDKEGKEEPDGKDGKKEGKGADSHDGELTRDGSLVTLRVELTLQVPLSDLKGSKGPLKDFSDSLKEELAKSAKVPSHRIDVLDIRGEGDGGASLLSTKTETNSSHRQLSKRGGTSIIDLEILPGTHMSDPSGSAVFERIEKQLGDSDSDLMKGPLKDRLSGATLEKKEGVQSMFPGLASRRSGSSFVAAIVAALSLPIAVASGI